MAKNEQNKPYISLSFDLGTDSQKEKIRGQADFYPDRIEITEGDKKRQISTEKIKKYKCPRGVGCIMLEAEAEDGDYLILRATMENTESVAEATKHLNRALDTGIYADFDEELTGMLCPKCHRPFPPGSKTCPRCADKGKYLLRLWQMAKPFRKYIYISVIIYFVISGINLLLPYFNRVLVDDYINADKLPTVGKYILAVAMILIVNVVSRLLTMLRTYTQTIASSKVIVRLRSIIFDKIQHLSLARVSKRTSGELMNRVTEDTGTIQRFITDDIGALIEQVLMLLGVGILLFAYNWRLALLIIMPAPLVILSHRLMWRFLRARYGKQWQTGAKANTILHDIFSGIRVVKAFGTEKAERKRYDDSITEERAIRASNETYFAVISPITSFLMGVGEFFLLAFVGNAILGGEMTFGEMQQFSSYVSLIYGPLRWLAMMPRRLTMTMTSVVKVFDVIDEESDVADKKDAITADVKGDIEIRNMSFGYESGNNVLHNINLTIKPGEMIGIVGRSGVGKSTLINLIMRMYDPDDGTISIGGTDIRDFTQESLRRQMGVVLQETMLFSGTLYNNIAYSKPDATPDEVITAARLAGVHKFAVKLADGYNTIIGEKGYTLSGGERQRVAIARALLHDPRFIILDEATSALDTETEKDIQDALQQLIAGRTTIAIAHRLSTLRNATRLVVLDAGEVAEVGTHDELMKKKGIYFDLVMAQRQMSKMGT
ncbi:MAG: ATP-binding cassette domain-containing protein [Ruminococcaceae bacterium]|nr:ATP-binding cassette domain-containing protein [Oscillospiraceae bacterium]